MTLRSLGLVAACASAAAADVPRVATPRTPDLRIFDALWPLDREYGEDHVRVAGSVAIGAGRHRDEPGGTAAASLAVGRESDNLLVAWRSDVAGWSTRDGSGIERGRHRGIAYAHTAGGALVLGLDGTLAHGDAPGLAPAHLGPGRRITADAIGEAQLMFDPDDDDGFAFAIRPEAGRTRWLAPDAPATADRAALTLAFGPAPGDGELPHGMGDLVHARVEHTSIEPRTSPVAAIVARRAEVRTVEVGLGAHDITLHIDRELAAVIAADLGWAWLEADTVDGTRADNLFRMRLSTAIRWRAKDPDRWSTRYRAGRASEFPLRELGIAIARTPEHAPDGRRLLSDWRLELAGALHTRQLGIAARGGISWLSQLAGPDPEPPLSLRYGSQLDAYVVVGGGFELGAYHAMVFEPATSDPFAGPRRWAIESGVIARWRGRTK
ncbi:MAG TPA: hypothetical protein VFQ53_15060 [Kofleriaceae bacterium]|nr:hypothetical protein [Kofleriaceae bacterium]